MEDQELINKLKKIWENPKGKAAIKLAGYLLIIIAISVIAAIGSRMKSTVVEETEEVKTLTYNEKIAKLEDYNFAYVYEVTKGEEQTIFRGVRYEARELGYKETANETIRYYIDDKYYEVLFGELNLYEDLYAETNYNLINISYILEEITTLEGELEEETYEKCYVYIDILDNITFKVYFDSEKITKILTTDNESTAILIFSKLGGIAEKDLSLE